MQILVLGAGSWGTALALTLTDNGNEVLLWSNESEHVQEMLTTGQNALFLPNKFPASIKPIADFTESAKQVKDIIVVVPSHGFRGTLEMLAPHISTTARVCWATKGLENNTGLLLHQVAEQTLGKDRALAVLSGPSFAAEVAKGLPTAVTIAATDEQYAKDLVDLFHNNYFRPYTSTDIVGVQLGGTVKNIMAIASGIVDGLQFGANSRAALITRGLAEMVRFGVALGGKKETFMGLAGMGDLVLTCTDKLSRNYRFGLALAKGSNVEQAQTDIGQVVEGVRAAREVNRVAKERNIDMPIVEQVNNVLQGTCTPTEAVKLLLSRQPKAE
ncbi:NAD(P)H-dependent glycerol-3-phosphate dehydrogenase [Candidatus Halobeggiatoa sp. HSG11]|nr:NAD(P)H-dependent glycerol-3-phosphate dehydrogenase [Candidatus Halobeggiatoa sp. HSG11]